MRRLYERYVGRRQTVCCGQAELVILSANSVVQPPVVRLPQDLLHAYVLF